MPTEEKQLKPWAQGIAANWAHAARATILADMGKVRPASALSSRLKKGRFPKIPQSGSG
ncbi:MAG: hypothetical protein HY343_13270 [Lentisphaerae bacterium]|nr:hypothetical protein [Lentisphaerota bacterium]